MRNQRRLGRAALGVTASFGILVLAALGEVACSSSDDAHAGAATGGQGGNAGAGQVGSAGTAGMTTSGGAAGVAGSSTDVGSGGGSAVDSGSAGAGGSSDDGGSSAGDGATASPTGPFYVSPTGSGTACSSTQPCSITQAQMTVRQLVASMQTDLVVQLADGTYRLSAPLSFTEADSGTSGHHVTWQAAPNAHPILSGGQRVTGFTMHDAAKNIWQASVGTGFDARQLYVDGLIAIRARTTFIRTEFDFSGTTGFTFPNAKWGFLNNIVDPTRVEINAFGTFTNRYNAVQSISNGTVVMVQPAWKNNTWGYETIPHPFANGPAYLENAYEFLDQPGEWFLDTKMGVLFYEPLAGQDLAQADVELPKLQSLIQVGGTYDQPAHDLVFTGLQFSHTSWLAPGGPDGYACQQSGTFISGGNYPEFEATRPVWHQMPGAVQISAAKNITFLRNRFINLGQLGLGIGNDANAHASGVGLGVDGITITGNVFTQDSGGGIVLGGVQADAHHPKDPRMINQNITLSNNLIHDVSIDFKDMVSILVTYTTNATVSHNEVYNLPYSGMSLGYGWGSNDAGGSSDYMNRGLYKYQPVYTTPTTAKNNLIVGNLLHDAMRVGGDGGCIYNLSANPGTILKENHCLNMHAGLGALYNDEGSRYLTWTNNVAENSGSWSFANFGGPNTSDLTLIGNWTNNGNTDIQNGNRGCVVMGTVVVTNGGWPPAAAEVRSNAGLEPAFASLKMP